MAGRRRGARTGRGWDAAPPRPRASRAGRSRPADPTAGFADPTAERDGRTTGSAAVGGGQPVDEAQQARDICLRQLAVRPRTRAELAAVLRRRGISEATASSVLDRYDEVGMIDDAAFAQAWVTSRHHGRGLARRNLAAELRQRGVDPQTARDALDGLDESTERATATELVERKLRTARGAPDVVFRRLVAMLARKGYSAGVAVPVVREALAVRSAEAAQFTDTVDAEALIGEVPDPDAE
ncbi:regulatory protein RecX [Solwaraspora sp. WMMA2080]|uniref:regulatory protein RecX n=1 Tax=unclassified Solwaraspora TaxID=2627926 RepID=UPI00248D2FE5|nr:MULTISPECIES: regulatory protein RecX [unclassified Solwaraspora]WBB98649.1 regulatory protein RecX [Solwaraspora sp. WMMA2059]WBC22799.1 regulatory protein RecX [Solwaraspora sp. WMMA2080]